VGTRIATELFWLVPGSMALLAQWVGVIAMRREGGGGVVLMTTGVVISTLALVAGLIGLGVVKAYAGKFGEFDQELVGMCTVVTSVFGQLAFAAGFAMHALRPRDKGVSGVQTVRVKPVKERGAN
jgi:adenine deaminase